MPSILKLEFIKSDKYLLLQYITKMYFKLLYNSLSPVDNNIGHKGLEVQETKDNMTKSLRYQINSTFLK